MRNPKSFLSRKMLNMLYTAAFVTVLLGSTLWIINWIQGTVSVKAAEEERLTPAYVNYFVGTGYITDESSTAIAAYIAEHPEPQNIEVLVGLNTSEVWGYMTNIVAGGLQQDCSYCHIYSNFGAETLDEYLANDGTEEMWQNKKTARAMLQMTADLNQNWLTQVDGMVDKQRSGAQIVCATCHLGQANFAAWPAEQHALPDDYRLPIGDTNNDGIANVADIDHMLLITGNDEDYSVTDSAQYNQNTMYHMNESLGVGCTHCHNARYFPSWEQPAKQYAYTMLQMTQHLQNEYSDIMNGQEPSCVMCHRNQIRPPGAAKSEVFIPPPIGSSYVPEQ